MTFIAPTKASIDIGYGDAVVPAGRPIEVPKLFEGGDSLWMPAYSIEAFLAEKTETVVSGFPGKTVPRLKDFYDIATVTRSWSAPMSGPTLLASFRATFERRRTAPDGAVFQDLLGMATDDPRMEKEWGAFKARAGVGEADLALADAIRQVAVFATPLLAALESNRECELTWVAGRGWADRAT